MEKEKAIEAAKQLLAETQLINLATVAEDGSPEVRMMLNGGTDGLDMWMITNASSPKMEHIKSDPRVCIFAADPQNMKGLKVCGRMEIVEDMETKKVAWQEEWRQWYPNGIDDPEFTLMKLKAEKIVYSEGMDYSSIDL